MEKQQKNVYREPINHNEIGDIQHEDSKQQKQRYLFQSKKIRNKMKKNRDQSIPGNK